MSKLFQLLALALIGACHSLEAQHIEFPLDTNSVIIDGILSPSEWQHASVVLIPVNTAENVEVRFKHDNIAMYFAFSGKLESANALFPEVLTDAGNAGGSNWTPGQFWFHVSATDCENDGGYGVYSNCMAVQPDWQGAPNFITGPPATDTVEMRIPFSKVGFNPATMDTMGMVMMLTNTATIFKTYPVTADRNVPSTWGKATFAKHPVSITTVTGESLRVYPNPAKEVLYITGLEEKKVVKIADVTGCVVKTIDAGSYSIKVDVSGLHSGIYYIQITGSRGHSCKPVLISR